jgi:hypothetical protein
MEEQRIYSGEVVIADLARRLAPDTFVLEELVFENAVLLGPAVVVPKGTTQFRSNVFEPNVDQWLLRAPPDWKSVVGVVGALNCLFEGCRFDRVAFLGDDEWVDRMRTDLGL